MLGKMWPWSVNLGFGSLIIATFFVAASSLPLFAVETSPQSLEVQVVLLSQACQSDDEHTVESLQDLITRCDALSKVVKQSDHLQKKLFAIRLKKSRNLCLYLLQLQQRE